VVAWDVCTLLIYRGPLPGVDLAVAANRDELFARPRGRFGTIRRDPPVVGGIDPEAGGTWLAASAHGFVVAVTNARLGARRGPGQRSRGLLARDLALCGSIQEARRRLSEEDLGRYAPVNVIVAGPDGITLGANLPRPRVADVDVAEIAVGNRPAFAADERTASLLALGRPRPGEAPDRFAARLQELLARHEDPPACHRLPHGGTVSSTVLLLRRPFEDSLVLHADGPPCRAPWSRIALTPGSP